MPRENTFLCTHCRHAIFSVQRRYHAIDSVTGDSSYYHEDCYHAVMAERANESSDPHPSIIYSWLWVIFGVLALVAIAYYFPIDI